MPDMKEFWERSQSEKFKYGQCDCVLWIAKYIEAKTGKHPAPDVVGSYDTPLGAARLMQKAGGLDKLVASYMTDFDDGSEVGVFEINGRQICGIPVKGRVALKTPDGLMVLQGPKLIKGWTV